MRLRLNIAIGYLSAIWSAAVGFFCVPIFVHYLGIESYGLIGFFASAQAVLLLLDMGLATTINREVSRAAASGRAADAANLVHTVGVIYWSSAVMIGLTVYLLAQPIAAHWLRTQALPRLSVEQSIVWAGVVIACRWPIGLYQGVLLGAQRIATTSGISILMVTVANVGAITVLALVSATVEAFFMWQAAVGLLHTLSARFAAWRTLAAAARPRFDAAELHRVASFALGMMAIAVAGVLLTQTDKLILSRMLPLADFGRYTLAGVVASGLYLVLTPTFNIIYPRMSALVARGDEEGLANFYRTGSRLLSAVLFPVAATAAVYSYDLLALWTRDPALADSTSSITAMILVGTALNGSMHFPYALQLAAGATRLPLMIYPTLIVVMVPLTIGLATEFGAMGGAMAWALLNVLYLALGTWLTHRSLLQGLGLRWLMSDVIVPASVSVATIGLSSIEIRALALSSTNTLAAGSVVMVVCAVSLLLMTHRTRAAIRSVWSTARP